VSRELPSGTVTFVFTDVEGSTKLLHEVGAEAYAQALAEHRRLLREAFSAHDGVEVDTQGDAFFYAFPSAAGQLTPQELQVALVVGQGATNREAGAALFLSPKTIEAHLGRIYRKLNVRSRTELAGLLAGEGALASTGR
jgi:DNA-binding CsgD family transcriptional regulator